VKATTNESLREENKKLKQEKEHLKVGLSKFTRGQSLQSELLMNTVMKTNRSGIGYMAKEEKKAKAQHQQYKSKPKPKRCFVCGQEVPPKRELVMIFQVVFSHCSLIQAL
jgi:hypothetical protein